MKESNMKLEETEIAKMFLEMYADIKTIKATNEGNCKRQDAKEKEQDEKLCQLVQQVDELKSFKTKLLTISSIIAASFSAFFTIFKK